MEIKLLQEFDYNDKGSLFEQMDTMNDAIVKEIREDGNSLYIILHKFDDILSPSGEMIYPYKELEIEYEYEEKDCLDICVCGKSPKNMTLYELLDWSKKEKTELEMIDWMITSGGTLVLELFAQPKNMRRKSSARDVDVEIQLLPKKIIYRWMS